MKRRPTQREKTQRAWGAYLDLVDTADWIRRELRGPLAAFGLTIEEFRLLVMLYRDGPLTMSMAAERRSRTPQAMHLTIVSAEEFGWVQRQIVALKPTVKSSRVPRAKRGRWRLGRRMGIVRLTAQGEKLIGNVLPKQAKLVKAWMRALDGREQTTLSQLCGKLREGDVVKFYSEITHLDEEED
jgi:DNA-binding MarR family transcriptional regulator